MWYWLLFGSHSIWAESDLLFHLGGPFLFLPKRHSSLTHNHKKMTLLQPFLHHLLKCAGVQERDMSKGQPSGADRQADSPPKHSAPNSLPLTLMWISSIWRENRHKGAQRLSAADSSCIMQSLLSIPGLGTDLLPSSSPTGIHSICYTHADDRTWSALPTISKYQVSNSTPITVKYFYRLYWSSIPGWFLLCIKKVK